MQNSRASLRSKNLFYNLKVSLEKFKLTLAVLILKLFGDSKTLLKKTEFEKIIRFGDLKVAYDQIDKVFEELKDDNNHVSVKIMETELAEVGSNPSSQRFGNKIEEQNLEGLMLEGLKQVKDTMLRQDPYYVFDLYDQNKDGKLDVEEFNNLLVGCSKVLTDLDLRKKVIRVVLKQFPKFKISQNDFLKSFGLDQVPKRVVLPQPAPNLLAQDDKQVANIYINMSKIAPTNLYPTIPTVEKYNPPASNRPETNYPKAINYYRSQVIYGEMLALLEHYLSIGVTFVDNKAPALTKGEYVSSRHIFKSRYYLYQIAQSVIERQKDRKGVAQHFQPKDIIQGSLGDCYLLSSLSSIVDLYPQAISDLFLFDVNPSGLYVVRLFNDGEWTSIVLDDRFPCVNNRPIFAKPHNSEIWVMLLEKAWAKLHGSYQSIDLGTAMEAMIALTGAPCKYYRKGEDDLKKKIGEGFIQGSVITCSGGDELNDLPQTQTDALGLIPKHAYSVQKLVVIDANTTLIKIRNPWGNLEWKGSWSFSSTKWTDSLRKKYNYTKDPQDGSFYMLWEDFERYFGNITICYFIPNYVVSSHRSTNSRHKSSYITMRVFSAGKYTLSIYQESKRKYHNNINYELSESRCILLRKLPNTDNYDYVMSLNKASSNLHMPVDLQKGEYLIGCKVAWIHFDAHEFVAAVYGPAKVEFSPCTKPDIGPIFKRAATIGFARIFKGERIIYDRIGINEAFRQVKFSLDQGIGYVRIVNRNSRRGFWTSINLPKNKGVKLIKPYKLPLEANVKPGDEYIYGFYLSAKGFSYNLQEKMKEIPV